MQPLEGRQADGFAASTCPPKFLLNGINCNVLKVTLFGEDVISRFARIRE